MAVAALVAAFTIRAQEPGKIVVERGDTIYGGWEFYIPDSLARRTPWHPDYRNADAFTPRPVVSMTSVIVMPKLPSSVMVLNNNSLRLGQNFTISNGQAWNWGPYPNSFLDARTLSMPLPR